MSITYCANCGKKIEYIGVKPEECPACNEPLGSVFKISESTATVSRSRPVRKQRIQYANNEFENDDFEIVIPDASDVQVDGFKKFTVANLKNGEMPPALPKASDLPSDTEVTSRAYFQKQD